MKIKTFRRPILLLVTIGVVGLVTAFSPIEKTLGVNLRIVMLHGAWVWTGMIAFGLAGLIGLTGLVTKKEWVNGWSRVWGWTGMIFWLTYLPMALVVMQMNWGGFFFDEPRWRVPFTFAVIGLLMHVGLILIDNLRLTSLLNLLFGMALWWSLRAAGNVLHPDSPIAQSGAVRIQIFFGLLLALVLFSAIQIAFWLKQRGR